MLTPEQIADGWIAHDVGACPVDPDSKPAVLFRDGCFVNAGEGLASIWVTDDGENFWLHKSNAPSADIIAYRPEKPHD